MAPHLGERWVVIAVARSGGNGFFGGIGASGGSRSQDRRLLDPSGRRRSDRVVRGSMPLRTLAATLVIASALAVAAPVAADEVPPRYWWVNEQIITNEMVVVVATPYGESSQIGLIQCDDVIFEVNIANTPTATAYVHEYGVAFHGCTLGGCIASINTAATQWTFGVGEQGELAVGMDFVVWLDPPILYPEPGWEVWDGRCTPVYRVTGTLNAALVTSDVTFTNPGSGLLYVELLQGPEGGTDPGWMGVDLTLPVHPMPNHVHSIHLWPAQL